MKLLNILLAWSIKKIIAQYQCNGHEKTHWSSNGILPYYLSFQFLWFFPLDVFTIVYLSFYIFIKFSCLLELMFYRPMILST